jgi:hypothetical protein
LQTDETTRNVEGSADASSSLAYPQHQTHRMEYCHANDVTTSLQLVIKYGRLDIVNDLIGKVAKQTL